MFSTAPVLSYSAVYVTELELFFIATSNEAPEMVPPSTSLVLVAENVPVVEKVPAIVTVSAGGDDGAGVAEGVGERQKPARRSKCRRCCFRPSRPARRSMAPSECPGCPRW